MNLGQPVVQVLIMKLDQPVIHRSWTWVSQMSTDHEPGSASCPSADHEYGSARWPSADHEPGSASCPLIMTGLELCGQVAFLMPTRGTDPDVHWSWTWVSASCPSADHEPGSASCPLIMTGQEQDCSVARWPSWSYQGNCLLNLVLSSFTEWLQRKGRHSLYVPVTNKQN